MTECVVCDGLGCEFCAKVTEAKLAAGDKPIQAAENEALDSGSGNPGLSTPPPAARSVLLVVLLWDIAFWLALVVLIGWIT